MKVPSVLGSFKGLLSGLQITFTWLSEVYHGMDEGERKPASVSFYKGTNLS